MPRAQSMMSLSPSIATSINLSPDSALNGPRLYLDVIHSTGELNTISLSGTGGLSETSSVRAHFQAIGIHLIFHFYDWNGQVKSFKDSRQVREKPKNYSVQIKYK